jgi:PilZ domain
MSAAKVICEPSTITQSEEELARQAEFILSALDAGQHRSKERRHAPRVAYRVRAMVRLYSDPDEAQAKTVFTRDVSPRCLGFVTPHRLPLGYGGVLEFEDPEGNPIKLDCTLLRCHETADGWFEGSVYFNRPQWQFSKNNTE